MSRRRRRRYQRRRHWRRAVQRVGWYLGEAAKESEETGRKVREALWKLGGPGFRRRQRVVIEFNTRDYYLTMGVRGAKTFWLAVDAYCLSKGYYRAMRKREALRNEGQLGDSVEGAIKGNGSRDWRSRLSAWRRGFDLEM